MNKKIIVILSVFLVAALTLGPLLSSFGSIRFGELFELITSKTIFNILRFTIFQAILSTAFSFLVGFPIAYYFARSRGFISRLLYYTTFIPFFLPGISMVTGFLVVYGRLGILNNIITSLGFDRIQILYTLPAIILGHVFYNSPIMIKVVGEAIRKIPRSIIESSTADGAGTLKTFWHIELPMIIPAVITSMILIFSYCFTSFAVVLVLGGSQYATLEVAIYMYLKLLGRPDVAIALSLVQFFFIFVFGLVVSFMEKKETYEYEPEPFIKKLTPLIFLPILYLIFEWFPIIGSFIASVFDIRNFTFIFDKLKTVFTLDVIPEIGTSIPVTLGNSVMLSLATSILGIIIIFSIVWSLRRSRHGSRIVRLLSLICLSVTPSIMALSYTISYPILPVPVLMIFLYFIISFPVGINMLYGETASLDFSMIEAAKVDGASGFQIIRKIVLPILKTPLVSTGAVIFSMAMGEFSGSLILGGDRFPTATVAIYRLLSSRHVPEARFMSSLLVVFVISIIALFTRSFKVADHSGKN